MAIGASLASVVTDRPATRWTPFFSRTPGGRVGGVRVGQYPGAGMTAAYLSRQRGDQRGADTDAPAGSTCAGGVARVCQWVVVCRLYAQEACPPDAPRAVYRTARCGLSVECVQPYSPTPMSSPAPWSLPYRLTSPKRGSTRECQAGGGPVPSTVKEAQDAVSDVPPVHQRRAGRRAVRIDPAAFR